MKTQRLTEIVFALMNNKRLTAAELASRFCVSVRTIYRDIETLSVSGIPVTMGKGRGGGIQLLEAFRLDGAILTPLEKAAAETLFAVHAQSFLMGAGKTFYDKLSAIFPAQTSAISIGSIERAKDENDRAKKFKLLTDAINERRKLRIQYLNAQGQFSEREIHPLQLGYRFGNWYLYAFCTLKNDFRFFKFSRIQSIFSMSQNFSCYEKVKENVFDSLTWNNEKTETVILEIDRSKITAVYETFPKRDISVLEDGNLRIVVSVNVNDWFKALLLSFADALTVVEPKTLKEDIKSFHKNAFEKQ